MNEAAIIQRLDRIERLIKAQLAPKKKEVWLRTIDVMKMTGWNKCDMYRMRKSGVLVVKKVKTTYLYDADSIPQIFIKQNIKDALPEPARTGGA